MLERKPYSGPTRQLVLAFDIGTTCSGISYCILQPGQIPQPLGVLRYPGQGQSGDIKVPSDMYYDSEGHFKKAGYETVGENVTEQAIDEKWVKVEWWKLHLRPKHLSSEHIKDDDVPPLPKGKSIVDVLADFITYLFRCAETYIKESHLDYIWKDVKDTIQFIFTHPNGWEGQQQHQIRCAIELAGLVPGTPDGRDRVTFLTEGEAGLHFCMWNLFASGVPKQEKYPQGQGFVVIDAGGGTLDLSMYSMKLNPTSFEEIAPAECRLQGSVFVSRRAKALLENKLQGSNYGCPDGIKQITEAFDRTTKLHVSDAEHPAYIKFGSYRENDVDHGIKGGKLTLTGEEATQLFDLSIQAVVDAFEEQRRHVKDAKIPITMAFLIGGFGASDWLWSRLDAYFKSNSIELCRPTRVHKAVPDGALSYLVDHLVSSRVARATYGVACSTHVDEKNPEHLSRKEKWFSNASGIQGVADAFQCILHKGTRVHELKEFRYKFSCYIPSKSEFGVAELPILCYRGASADPQWIDCDRESFSTLFTIRFDLREVAKTLSPRKKLSNEPGIYYSFDIDLIMLFGSTEFTTQAAWQVNGVEKRSPAKMIYDSNN